MNTHPLYRLIYVSRNELRLHPDEMDDAVSNILSVSRRNNGEARVTGALLFNAECFAQVLEGDLQAVQATFERIQCDPRHRETVILQAGTAQQRDFGDWSMAYAGRVEDARLRFDRITAQPQLGRAHAADGILGMLQGVLQRGEAVA